MFDGHVHVCVLCVCICVCTQACKKAVDEAIRMYGKLDILVNNAGEQV